MNLTSDVVHVPRRPGERVSAADKIIAKAVALQMQGCLREAEACYRRAVALKPGSSAGWSNLGAVLIAQARPSEAMDCLERALAVRPDFVEALTNLAQALSLMGRTAEATDVWRRLLQIRTHHPDTWVGLALSLSAQRRHRDAIMAFERALELRPSDPRTLFGLGLLHLQHGNLAAGWPLFEHRYEGVFGHPAPHFAQPVWRGQPLAGKRLLLYHDQGLGDTIQFLRYIPLLQAAGAQVLLLLQPALRRLIRETAPETVAGDTFDLHCPLPSLPQAFGTTLETIPRLIPYLYVPKQERERAAARVWPVAGLRVGLLWAGNPQHPRDQFRSLPLAALDPILQVQSIHFFSLHLNECSDTRVEALHLDPRNMADAAAKLLHLDLILTVDTAIAHLAGALGLRVWLLLDDWPDWRWLLDCVESPWYPTARLFRQERPGDWEGVIQQVVAALKEFRDSQPAPSRELLPYGPASGVSARVL